MFMVKKAIKVALVARKAKSQRSKAKSLTLVPYCKYATIILSKRPIILYFSHMSLSKAKIGLAGLKIKRTSVNAKLKDIRMLT